MSSAFPARDADFDAVSSIPAAVQTALFEALSFVGLLEDAAVVEALAASLLRLSHECDLALAGTHDDTSGRKRIIHRWSVVFKRLLCA